MSLTGFKQVPIDGFGSLVSRVAPEAVTIGGSPNARNIRFKPRGIITRNGLTQTIRVPESMRVTGFNVLSRLNNTTHVVDQFPLVAVSNEAGWKVFKESPAGSGSTQLVSFGPEPHTYLDMASAYNRLFIAIGDLKVGSEQPTFFDGTVYQTISTPPPQSQQVTLNWGDDGDVAAGTRYCVVLFQTQYGFITGVTTAAISTFVDDDGGHKIKATDIPISTNPLVTKRILCFTVAGASQAGPYFYIPADDTVGDISITKTVIDNNTDTWATLNFTDEYLQGSTDITSPIDFFDKIVIPFQAAVFFSPSVRRLIWTGGFDDETIFRLSEVDDPETYLGSTGFIKPAQNDGERAITAREFRSQLFLFKEHAGFIVTPSDVDPTNWIIERRWEQVGPVGPWAVDVSEQFMVFLDQSGVYVYDGDAPRCISDEISSVDSLIWQQINWCDQQRFWVFIDTDLDEIHVGVALGESCWPTHVLKCSYLMGMNAGQRKWSIDDIPASRMIRVNRQLGDCSDCTIPATSSAILRGSGMLSADGESVWPHESSASLVGAGEIIGTSCTPDPVIATDNFNRADGPIGANWLDTEWSGHASFTAQPNVASNQCKFGVYSDFVFRYHTLSTVSTAQYAKLTLKAVTNGNVTGVGCGPAVFLTDVNPIGHVPTTFPYGYSARIEKQFADDAHKLYLGKNIGGVRSDLVRYSFGVGVNPPVDKVVEIRAQVNGSNVDITVLFDNVIVITYTDSSVTAITLGGKFGLVEDANDGTHFQLWDDFVGGDIVDC